MVSVMIVPDGVLRGIVEEAMPRLGELGRNLGRLLEDPAACSGRCVAPDAGSMRFGSPVSVYDDPSSVGQALRMANVRAWIDRYGDEPVSVEEYRHTRHVPLPAVRVLAMLDQLEYQIEEWKCYRDPDSEPGIRMQAFIDAVRRRAIQRLPGYSLDD